ncbi:MAG: hypothetical protein U0414_22705 [Polyangiaceae bacterium]
MTVTTEEGLRRVLARSALGVIMGATALAALAGGIYGLTGAKQLPMAWLTGSPFESYLVPSLVLLLVVGGSLAVATVAVVKRARRAAVLTVGAGLILLGWIFAEVIVIGYVSWLQPLMAIVAKIILVIAALEWSHLGPRERRTA